MALTEIDIVPEELVAAIEERLRAKTKFGSFYEVQREALLRVLGELVSKGRVRGIVQMPTGSGKTVLAAAVIAGLEVYYNRLGYEEGILSLFLTPRVVIRKQAYETFRRVVIGATKRARVKEVHGSEDFCIGLSGWNLGRYTTLVGIATPQLLMRVFREHRRCWDSLCDRVDVVIIDEAHTYCIGEKVSQAIKELVKSDIPVVLGLTATPLRDLIDLIGNLLYYKHSRELMDGHVLAKDLVLKIYRTRFEMFRPRHEPGGGRWDDPWLYAIRERASKYAEVIVEVLKSIKESYLGGTRYPKALVVASNTREADMLYEEISGRLRVEINQSPSNIERKLVFIAHYGIPNAHEQVKVFKRAREGILLAVNMVDIGFDDPNLEVLILARPIRSPIAYAQLRGRVLRKPQPIRGSSDTNLKTVYGAFIVDLVNEENKVMLEERVPLVEKGYYEKSEFDFAIAELRGVELGMVKEAEARVSVEHVCEYRVKEDKEKPESNELEKHVKTHTAVTVTTPLLVKCIKDLLSEKGVFELICPEKSGTRVRFKTLSYSTYICGRPEKHVVIEIEDYVKDGIKMTELLNKNGIVDYMKLARWILEVLRAQGLIRCQQFMLRQRVICS